MKKNIIYNTLYNLLSIFIPFITTPYVARVLGPAGVGLYSYSYSVAYYFVLFTMMGLAKYGTRMIAESQSKAEVVNNIFTEIYFMQIFFGVISTVAYVGYILVANPIDEVAAYIQLIYVVSAIFDISWLFFGLEKFKQTVLRNVLVRCLNVVSLFLFVKQPKDVYVYVFVMAFSTFLSQIILWPSAYRQNIRIQKVRVKDVLKHIRPNLLLFVPVISVSIYKIMDKIMLGVLVDTLQVGYYENAEKIINIPLTLITTAGTVLLPRMSKFISDGNKLEEKRYIDLGMNVTSMLSVAMAFGIISISNIFVPFFLGNDFNQCVFIVYLLAPTLIFISWGTMISNQVLLPYREDKILIRIVGIGACFNFALNWLLVPFLKANGVAIATLLTEFFVACGYVWAAKNRISVIDYLKNLVKFCLIGAIMFIIVFKIPTIYNSLLLTLIVKVVAGVIIYLFGVYVMARQRFLNISFKQ